MRKHAVRNFACQHLTRALAALIFFSVLPVTATETEGNVLFFVDANSSFDAWTRDPTSEQQAWMREHYFRMQTYSPYFDGRLSWYPNAWVYKDSYAIKPGWTVFAEHPEWVLRDTSDNMLYIPFACSGGVCPQYAADIGNPEYRSWWIAGAVSKVDMGYIGIWVDDVNFDWRISNGFGDAVRPRDPRTGQEMTLADWRRYFAEFLEELRTAIPSAEIAHNIIWYADQPEDPYIIRALRAADYINLERGITDPGIRSGSGKYGFESFLELADRVHEMGRQVIMDDDDDNNAVDRNYELAFYLLINNGGDLIGADGDRARMSPDNFWSGYNVQLGSEIAPRYRWNSLFRRDFDCGMVLVNQPGSTSISVNLDEAFVDLSGSEVTAVTLGPAAGAVLVKPCEGARRPMPPEDLE